MAYTKRWVCFFIISSLANLSYSQSMTQNLKETGIHITPSEKLVTLVNIIHVEPENYTKLLSLLEKGTDSLFSKQRGFRGVAIHSNAERNTILLYGQWSDRTDIDNFRKVPEIQVYFKSLLELAKFESIICESIPYINLAKN